eukprot:TRINITY_DN56_c0_g1_i3.p1 TRINITY_DN56_c0_g1~~TRINITY_DN56_c0_g1_i3.p1  ORF type:complete len:296 (-),score=50.54 TRINITY_DN56_c0_g1_i3:76-963(-)
MEYHRRGIFDYMMASAVSGSISRLIVHPIDTVRARMQVSRGTVHRGIFEVMKSTFKAEGAKGLYRGLGTGICFGAPASALYLGTYDWSKTFYANLYKNIVPAHHPLVHFSAAFSAEAVSGLVWTPMDVIKQRLQVQRTLPNGGEKYKNAFDAVRVITREEGLRTFFKGYGLQIGVFGPYTVLKFILYEDMKKRLTERSPNGQLSLSTFTACAVISGGVAAAITNPLDVVKTRIQVQMPGQERKYKNFYDALMKIYKEEGLRAFRKGLGSRVMWIAPSAAINLTIYEEIKILLNRK